MGLTKVFHIDCGRKYFSFEDLKQIVGWLGEYGYSAVELAFGNGGMRFLLNDMEIVTSAKTYDSTEVKKAIQAGNKGLCDCGTNELTESEMSELIRYAGERGVKIMPLLNTPGHMDAIVTAMESLGINAVKYKGSATTIDFDCAEAKAFTKALLAKYIALFAAKGSEYFNMGCDEYANDVLASGFAVLCDEKEYRYHKFVDYVNEVAAMVLDEGMQPVMFNDGMYYNEETAGGDFNSAIICSYWSVGWPGYTPASARFIEEKGHVILNTADKWYYVLGRREEQRPVVMFTDKDSARGIALVGRNEVLGGTANPPVGAMFCLWCDEPWMPYSDQEKDILNSLIASFAET